MSGETPKPVTQMQRVVWTTNGKLNWPGMAGFFLLFVIAQVMGRIAGRLTWGRPVTFDSVDWVIILLVPLIFLAGAWFFLPERRP